jgi:uncharacterized tellurite resistance protein B-like protein
MDAELGKKVCQLVAGIVITDEDLDPREEAFVERMLAGFGLDATQRDVIFPLVDGEEAAAEISQMPNDVQQEAFRLLLEAAAADGKIVDEEREYLRAVAAVMSISDEELERRLSKQLG